MHDSEKSERDEYGGLSSSIPDKIGGGGRSDDRAPTLKLSSLTTSLEWVMGGGTRRVREF
jgi:hypothetical protein